MKRKIRTPEEMAKSRPLKNNYSFYLTVSNMEYLKSQTKGKNLSVSELVDEAITNYIEEIKSRQKP